MTSAMDLPQPNMLAQAFELLNDLLAREKVHLNTGQYQTHEEFARQKLQILNNINRMYQKPEYANFIRLGHAEIEKLKANMQENQQLLKFRMDAIEEISQTISVAMREQESDGTYQIESSQRGYDQW